MPEQIKLPFSVRRAEPKELDRLNEFIAADPDHAGKCQAQFWIDQAPGVESVVFNDGPEEKPGDTDVYVRLTMVARLDVQFPPNKTREKKMAIAQLMKQGMPWLMAELKRRGIREVVFDSKSPGLIAMCKRFGFEAKENEFSARI
jgi:hypothetical protein